jgi:phage host-nuclease inhibitor protein Gam
VVEEARRIGSIADVQMSNMNAQAPVGTTLALLERTLKVMSGVQARMHNSLKQELRLLARVIHDYMGPEYSYDREGKFNRIEDFDGRVDVIPVSDPNAATMAQRVVQYQTALQLAQQAPQLYNMGKLHREMLEVLNIKDADEIVKLPGDIKPMDPVTENMAILKQEPVKAFMYQDHEAHIRVHMAAMQDPKIQQVVGQSPFAAAIQSAASAHITEHVAMQYRVEIQKQLGVEMPDPEAKLPEDVEREVSRLSALAADRLLQKNQSEAAQQAAQQAENDPLTQIQRAELQLEERRVALEEAKAQHQALVDKEKLEIERIRAAGNLQVQEDRLEAENQRTAAQIGARLATQLDAREGKERMKGAEIGLKVAENILKGAENGTNRGTETQD